MKVIAIMKLKQKVLVVDENLDSRELIRTILECKGYDVIFSSLNETIVSNCFDVESLSAIILDLTSFELKNEEKIIQFLSKAERYPTLVLVGGEIYCLEIYKKILQRFKNISFIEKPFNPNYLVEKLNKLTAN